MVRRVINLVYQEVRGLHQAAYVLALLALGSQMLALVRDRLLANQFGAGIELDLYYAAFRIPDLLYVVFASTLSVYVLIPFLAGYQATGAAARAQHLLSQIFSLFLVGYIVLAAALWAAAPVLVVWLFPGLVAHADTLVTLLRILLLQPLFLGVSSLCGVVTQLNHRFVLYAISPLVYNLGIIFGVVALYPQLGLAGLVWGVVIGAFLHLIIQWPLVRTSTLSFRWTYHIDWTELGAVFATSLPRAITLSLNQVVLLVLTAFASVMAVGSVSVFQFAFNLHSVPLAIIGVSYSVAAFPTLAQQWAAQEFERFRLHITTTLRHIVFWAVPATVLIIVLRAHIVRVVLGSGAFNWDDTRLTAAVLALLVFSLAFHSIVLVIVRAFYAGGFTRLPLLAMAAGAGTSVVLSYVFVTWFATATALRGWLEASVRVTDVAGTEVLLLAVAYSLAVMLQAAVLLMLARRHLQLALRPLLRNVGEALTAGLVGGIAAYATLYFVVEGINPERFLGIFLQGLTAGVVGLTGVVLTYVAFGSRELRELYRSFHGRIFKTDVVAPQKDLL